MFLLTLSHYHDKCEAQAHALQLESSPQSQQLEKSPYTRMAIVVMHSCVWLFVRLFCPWSELPFPSPGDLPQPRDQTPRSGISYTGRQIFYRWATWEAWVSVSVSLIWRPGLPRWLSGKDCTCQAGDTALILGSGNPLQWTEESSGVQSMGSQRARNDWWLNNCWLLFGKESACNAGDLGLIPGLWRSPGGGHGNPLEYSCLENPHGWGAWCIEYSWALCQILIDHNTWNYFWALDCVL